jgi:hypothetical protein
VTFVTWHCEQYEFRAARCSCLMKRTVAIASDEDFFVLSSLPPSRAQKWLALAVVLSLFAAWEQPQLFSEELRAAFRSLRQAT